MPSVLLQSLIDQYLPEWFGSYKQVRGQLLNQLVTQLMAVKSGIVAKAGGGQAGATLLILGFNEVTTVASANDSVQLPFAIPGSRALVRNSSANSMQVFGNASNVQNGGAADTIAAQGSTAYGAAGVAHLSGVKIEYVCFKLGQWDQGSIT